MKLEKAIEIMEKQRYSFPTDEMRVINDALKLGIEAGKRVKAHRESSLTDAHILLPGETKE